MKFSIRKKEKNFYFIGKDDKGIDIFTSENFQNYEDCQHRMLGVGEFWLERYDKE